MGHSEKKISRLAFVFLLLLNFILGAAVESNCSKGCHLALASYYIWPDSDLSFISQVFSTPISQILSFNPKITNRHYILVGSRVNLPFSCDCINGEFLGHSFLLSARPAATFGKIARTYFSNLTTVESLLRINSYDSNFVVNTRTQFNVTVNCSCGDESVSKDYGLFVTYPLQPDEDLSYVAGASGLSLGLLQRYNPDTHSSLANKLISGKDEYGKYPPLKSSRSGISSSVIIGISVAVIAGLVFLALCVCTTFHKRKTMVKASSLQNGHGSGNSFKKASESAATPALAGFSVNKTIEYSYKELAKGTNNFSIATKIGEGGFGAVFNAELRGERAAIKKMDLKASKEFLAELKVLTRVHHLNLVRSLGYCVYGSLFLVYEFIENGNLSQHLHGMGRDPLPWFTRVRIALDSARGLEYIHEHTVPVYIHRDIKPSNILIDKLPCKVGGASRMSGLVGTFGYMPPEYARYGYVSPKIDVYAFGVVLYELISARDAVVKTNGTITNTTGLVALFEDAFSKPEPLEELCKLVDPMICSDCPFHSVHKMTLLARARTQDNPQLRPSMRRVVVALIAPLSSIEDSDIGITHEKQALLNLTHAR